MHSFSAFSSAFVSGMEGNQHCHHLHQALAILVVILFVSVTGQGIVPSIQTDADSLLQFKNLIQEDPNKVLSSWKLSRSPCSWYGVTCSGGGRAIQLDLSGCSLVSDRITFDAFSSLDMLSVLKLSGNSFTVNSTSLLQLPYGIAELELSFAGIIGIIPEVFFSKYPNLVSLNLSYNKLSGSLPENFLLNLNKLQVLDLSYNNIEGSISALRVGNSCSSLAILDISGNHLSGFVPSSLSNCTNLKTLNLSNNFLTGEVPRSFGLLGTLQRLDLSHNQLHGWIPVKLGNTCKSLVQLDLSHNNLSGPIPDAFASCSGLQILDLSNNTFSGPFTGSFFRDLNSLEIMLLSNNNFSGLFPVGLSNCKKLRIADFSSNRFWGNIPPELCPGAAALEVLRIPDNLITGPIPAQLSQCSQLRTIDFSLNYINGSIPPELGSLGNLEQLIAWYNSLEGQIPPELGKCSKLKDLILNNNNLTGEIPMQLLNCSNLEWISFTSNGLSGEIPRELGLLSRLAVLQLGNNSFIGQIPPELGNCSSLVWLDLNSNKLIGEIPPRLGRQRGAKSLTGILSGNTLVFVRNVGNSCRGVGGLLEFAGIRPERLQQDPKLRSCDFTRLYSGSILSFFTLYQSLEYLDLSYNQLSGSIPEEIGEMVALQVLEISHNNISGIIPTSFGKLKNLGVFDASYNRLQGEIPDSFANLSFLVQIDLSYNQLTGEIPQRGQLSTLPESQFAHNPGLCGFPLHECGFGNSKPSANPGLNRGRNEQKTTATSWTSRVVLGIFISIASVCILVVCAIALRVKRKVADEVKMLKSLQASHAATTWKIEKEKEPLSINVATFQRQLRKLKFSQLIEATNGFSAASLIGYGGFGEVFKATLKDGTRVAIKKLIRLSYQGDREFMAEMETLGKIKHKNLVPLLGYCKVGEERLLVYEYMEFGSLEEMLHGKIRIQERRILTWDERKKIGRGAAKGLCFLHHNCIPHIIHRDMKSSNVLLDHEMEARVSDFGMARLISALDTHLSVSTLAGTPGYVPPEYYQSFRCTAKGDVYSFGVILLELLTGKRPTDKEDFGDSNLVGWVKMKAREGKHMEVIDPALLSVTKGTDEAEAEEVKEMIKYLEITLQCVEDFPSRRPNMVQVVAMLRELNPGSVTGSSNSS